MEWPMWLIRGDILASLPGITTHEDLVRQGKLCQWQPGHPRRVALISHQWVSVNHPDPQGKQLSVLQEALRNMASGKASVVVDAFTAGHVGLRSGIELAMPSAEEQRACLEWDYWYDYFSIPQLDVQSLHMAIKSIPAYCCVVDFTIVLAPCLQHEDSGEVLGVLSWQRRGWCRLERSASLFASRACLIMVTSPQKLVVKSGPEWVVGWPVEGDFSLETDRHMVGEVTSILLSIYRTGLWKKGDLQAWRFYTALMSKTKLYPDFPPNESLSHFLQRYNMSAADSSQLSPLMLASMEGNLSVMQALLREGCDIDATTKFEIPEAHVNGTNTALSLAAQISTPEAVQLLLQARASVNLPKAQGGVPLLTHASYFGNAAVLPLLIRAHADVNEGCFV
ncbi:mask-1, partial [Symbiodinium microadriaticum]